MEIFCNQFLISQMEIFNNQFLISKILVFLILKQQLQNHIKIQRKWPKQLRRFKWMAKFTPFWKQQCQYRWTLLYLGPANHPTLFHQAGSEWNINLNACNWIEHFQVTFLNLIFILTIKKSYSNKIKLNHIQIKSN